MSGWKKIFHANGNEKKPGIAKLVSDEVYFKMKSVTRQRRAIYINKGINTSKGYTFVNIYVPNIRIAKYIKQILTNINGEIDSNTIIVGKFNTLLTSMDRLSRRKISKETRTLYDTLNKMNLIDIYRIFYPKAAEYMLFSSAHGTFSRINHILRHKTSLNKFKSSEIISSIFYNYNGIKLEISYRRKNGENTNMWRLNNKLLKNKWVNEGIKEAIRKYLDKNKNKNITFPNLWDTAKAALIGKFIAIQAHLKK